MILHQLVFVRCLVQNRFPLMLLISGGYIYRVLLLCSPYLLTTTTDTKILNIRIRRTLRLV